MENQAIHVPGMPQILSVEIEQQPEETSSCQSSLNHHNGEPATFSCERVPGIRVTSGSRFRNPAPLALRGGATVVLDTRSSVQKNPEIWRLAPEQPQSNLECKNCEKTYRYSSSLNIHQDYNCKYKKREIFRQKWRKKTAVFRQQLRKREATAFRKGVHLAEAKMKKHQQINARHPVKQADFAHRHKVRQFISCDRDYQGIDIPILFPQSDDAQVINQKNGPEEQFGGISMKFSDIIDESNGIRKGIPALDCPSFSQNLDVYEKGGHEELGIPSFESVDSNFFQNSDVYQNGGPEEQGISPLESFDPSSRKGIPALDCPRFSQNLDVYQKSGPEEQGTSALGCVDPSFSQNSDVYQNGGPEEQGISPLESFDPSSPQNYDVYQDCSPEEQGIPAVGSVEEVESNVYLRRKTRPFFSSFLNERVRNLTNLTSLPEFFQNCTNSEKDSEKTSKNAAINAASSAETSRVVRIPSPSDKDPEPPRLSPTPEGNELLNFLSTKVAHNLKIRRDTVEQWIANVKQLQQKRKQTEINTDKLEQQRIQKEINTDNDRKIDSRQSTNTIGSAIPNRLSSWYRNFGSLKNKKFEPIFCCLLCKKHTYNYKASRWLDDVGISQEAAEFMLPAEEERRFLMFKCSDCGVLFKHLNSWRIHMTKWHPSTSLDFICNVCHCSFYDQTRLDIHKSYHGGEEKQDNLRKEFRCTICDRRFRKGTFSLHRKCHGDFRSDEEYLLEEQGVAVSKHFKNADTEILEKALAESSQMIISDDSEMQEEKSNESGLPKCSKCDFSCGAMGLTRHRAAVHKDFRSHVAYMAQEFSVSVISKEKPVKKAKAKPVTMKKKYTFKKKFRCETCGKVYHKPLYLAIHRKREHEVKSTPATASPRRPYSVDKPKKSANVCTECQIRFPRMSDYKRHMREEHRNLAKQSEDRGKNPKKPTKKPSKNLRNLVKSLDIGRYPCVFPDCKLKFKEAGLLSAHFKRRHLNCNMCERSLRGIKDYRVHLVSKHPNSL